jgi:hypothetical protein
VLPAGLSVESAFGLDFSPRIQTRTAYQELTAATLPNAGSTRAL